MRRCLMRGVYNCYNILVINQCLKIHNYPGWTFAFFFKRRYTGEYLPDGSIKWTGETPPEEENIKKMIHELMTFHVYD